MDTDTNSDSDIANDNGATLAAATTAHQHPIVQYQHQPRLQRHFATYSHTSITSVRVVVGGAWVGVSGSVMDWMVHMLDRQLCREHMERRRPARLTDPELQTASGDHDLYGSCSPHFHTLPLLA